ncbi:MAG: alkaline phosphatase [Henriciella sp.]|jgi:alkaline phosphatase D|uniref:alkaline phosphatase D family protein n=1 Tax=Henriciella sp. TaxID=1968823 RepID=UPI000C116476|nr:alkaline phosphatase D family protein [Henriciella sp.]MAN74250.1 alkaline phosphatase [Henriciella sp.]MBF33197.1 alkaline phosphatase [Hyphomonadaceae bacterium]PHR69574.1 MAG: alkaline phosphatase [Henriciella sp.]|tara:strand:- start:169 stop:1356 length:1188 start_codon:yes stop_codon:yes gene_type:complete
MHLRSLAVFGAFGLVSCASQGGAPSLPSIFEGPPQSAVEALNRYYDTIDPTTLPQAPAGVSLPLNETLTSILLASCNDEELDSPTLAQLAREDADLFLMIGDNVYGDRDGRDYANNQPELDELRESFEELATRPEFQAVRAKFPMMVAWDDHDYGTNDGGRDFPFKQYAELIHETFWGLVDDEVGQYPGTYYERTFGPEGQRVQVIVLDTRFFRSDLTPTDDYGAEGKERYMPAPEGSYQDMLGSAQWTWLQNRLQDEAELRFIVSSVQVMPTVHGWESWDKLPAERERLFELVRESDAGGVVFLSGDRHTGFIYEEQGVLPYEANELTASSLNVAFAEESPEMDPRQVGAPFPPENYGEVEIDWQGRQLSLLLKNSEGETVRENVIAFDDIGVK